MATKLVNNGLPQGLHFKDISHGDILLVKWKDAEPSHHVVVESHQAHKPKSYKGYVSFMVSGERLLTVDGDQVIRKVGNIVDVLAKLDAKISKQDRQIRYA